MLNAGVRNALKDKVCRRDRAMSAEQKTLYQPLGGYDAIAAVANDLLPRLRNDPQLGRFWKNRAEDSIMRKTVLCERSSY
jgi:hypothetical protein